MEQFISENIITVIVSGQLLFGLTLYAIGGMIQDMFFRP